MKKMIVCCVILTLLVCLISCKGQEENAFGITHIEFAYSTHNLADPIIIEDEATITKLATYIENAAGERDPDQDFLYGVPYCFTLHYNDGSTVKFNLYGDGKYASSKDVKEDGDFYYYLDDMSEMYEYVKNSLVETEGSSE